MTTDPPRFQIEDPEGLIQSLQRELAATNHEVLLLNLELEKRVDERTAELRSAKDELQRANRELEIANRELEAFCYSISHDLRAPLRAVSGFSKVILEDFGPQLPAECKRLLNTVVKSVDQMRTMIDDLLRLSRAGRCSLSRQTVNVTSLVQSVLEELRNNDSLSNFDFRLSQLPQCNGDASLLKQVFVNLLSNAVKFSRQKNKPVIEIGSLRQNRETVYFVRDNGAGFDMQFADKLFGVFQRLHDEQQFEGTGIGLSIVRRIIDRHGGRIWAESAPDKGATFFFTLPGP